MTERDTAADIDPSRCPLCGDDNRCGAVLCRTFGGAATKSETCWCYTASFAPGVLACVPDAAKNKACLCERCATAPLTIGNGARSDHRE